MPNKVVGGNTLSAPFPAALRLGSGSAVHPRPALGTSPPTKSVWSVLPSLELSADLNSTDTAEHAGSRIVADARQEAVGILRDACNQAAETLAKADAEANTTRSAAAEEGYAEGLLRARSDVEADLTERFNRRVKELHAAVDDTVRSIVEAREAMWRDVESEIMSLSLEIARKVIKVEVQDNHGVAAAVIKDALRRVVDRDSVRIVVHPSLLDEVREQRADLILALDNVQNLAIDSDQRVSPGGCLIETSAGCIDAKVETQLEQVEQALRP